MMTQHLLPYWRNEQGELPAAVQKLVCDDQPLTDAERSLIAAYLQIWLTFPGWALTSEIQAKLNQLQESLGTMVAHGDRSTIWRWLEELLVLGIDPL